MVARKKPKSLKEALKGALTEKEMKSLVTSFDIIGDIAIIEIPPELSKKEKKIGKAILEVHKNVKTVCKRRGIHKGVFRIRPVKVIAGKKKTETLYKEHGVLMKLDIAKVYFTPRLSHERERIAEQVKKGEVIGAFFAGVGPFPLVIFKKQPNVKIYAVELNPDAFKYLEDNIRINKAGGAIEPILGDVRELGSCCPVMPRLDRILMPLPKGGEDFLPIVFERIKAKGIIHFYQFGRKEKPYVEALRKIKAVAKGCGRKIKIIRKKEVRPYSPGVVQIVIDFRVL